MEPDIDVVVAGAGAAGCAAALAAGQGAARVLVAEADPLFRRSCNTSMSTSMIPAAGSRWQAEAGIDDSPARFRADIEAKTKGSADPLLARALTEVGPGLVAWLNDDCTVPLGLVTDFVYPGHSRPRCHSVEDRSGATMHRHLLEALAADPRIDLAVPMRLDGLEQVDGLWRVALGGETVVAHAVVLATSGFAGNRDLVVQHLPGIANALYFGGEGSQGDALALAEPLGADTAYLDAYQGHGSVAVPAQVLLTWAAVMHGGVLLNAHGRRFGDETVGYSEYGEKVVAQPGGEAWFVYDGRIHEAIQPFKDYQDLLEAGGPTWCDDDASVAEVMGAPIEVVTATLEGARAAALGVRDDEHGRTQWSGPLVAPYAVQRVTGALFHTQGGLRVDGHGQVLRGGVPIGGLYAAGGAAMGISGHGPGGYLAGNGLLGALGLGLLAGRHAAALVEGGG